MNDTAFKRRTDQGTWAFILFAISMTAVNVIMWLHFIGVIN